MCDILIFDRIETLFDLENGRRRPGKSKSCTSTKGESEILDKVLQAKKRIITGNLLKTVRSRWSSLFRSANFYGGWSQLMDIRRLLLCCWLFAGTFLVAVNGLKPKCDELTGTVAVDAVDMCDVKNGNLGNTGGFAALDFSKSTKNAFGLLAKGFDKIYGAFVMDGNEQVDALNFANIKYFDGVNVPPSKS